MNYRVYSLAFSALALAPALMHAQSTATLSGVVTDPSGAVVPQAKLTVHGPSTGVARSVVSDSYGK